MQGEHEADVLSRLHINGETIHDDKEDIPNFFIDEENHDNADFIDLVHVEDDLPELMEPE